MNVGGLLNAALDSSGPSGREGHLIVVPASPSEGAVGGLTHGASDRLAMVHGVASCLLNRVRVEGCSSLFELGSQRR